MRVIAGRFRRTRLSSVPGLDVRPTADRLRQSVFDILMPYIEGARVWDACAGTGAVEALRAGARPDRPAGQRSPAEVTAAEVTATEITATEAAAAEDLPGAAVALAADPAPLTQVLRLWLTDASLRAAWRAAAVALERLRAFDLAAEEYRLAAELDRELAVEAGRSADLCQALHDVSGLGVDLDDLADQAAIDSDPDSALAGFEQRGRRLESLERVAEGTHHVYVVREELERTDMARAEYFVGLRQILPEGDVRAAAELQRLVTRHRESKYINRHILAMAEFYEELAVEYVDANPPESLRFDPVHFQELIEATSRLYEVVAGQDGKPEKLEASRKLEAFLAFALRVDRDRFMP